MREKQQLDRMVMKPGMRKVVADFVKRQYVNAESIHCTYLDGTSPFRGESNRLLIFLVNFILSRKNVTEADYILDYILMRSFHLSSLIF